MCNCVCYRYSEGLQSVCVYVYQCHCDLIHNSLYLSVCVEEFLVYLLFDICCDASALPFSSLLFLHQTAALCLLSLTTCLREKRHIALPAFDRSVKHDVVGSVSTIHCLALSVSKVTHLPPH